MCHYESFISCCSPSWPLMIQQNYFISAFPHSRVLLQRAVAEYLALPEVAVPGNVSRDTGVSLPEAQCSSMLVAEGHSERCRCDVMQRPGLTSKQRLIMACQCLAGQKRGGSGCSCRGWVVVGRVPLCRERLGASAEPLPAPCAALLLHHTAYIFLTSSVTSWRSFCRAEGKMCGR